MPFRKRLANGLGAAERAALLVPDPLNIHSYLLDCIFILLLEGLLLRFAVSVQLFAVSDFEGAVVPNVVIEHGAECVSVFVVDEAGSALLEHGLFLFEEDVLIELMEHQIRVALHEPALHGCEPLRPSHQLLQMVLDVLTDLVSLLLGFLQFGLARLLLCLGIQDLSIDIVHAFAKLLVLLGELAGDVGLRTRQHEGHLVGLRGLAVKNTLNAKRLLLKITALLLHLLDLASDLMNGRDRLLLAVTSLNLLIAHVHLHHYGARLYQLV